MDEFEPNNFFLCEVPPLKYKLENCSKNKLYDELNGLLSSKHNGHAFDKFVIIRLNEFIRNVSRVTNTIADYNQLYHDNVHLNHRKNIP